MGLRQGIIGFPSYLFPVWSLGVLLYFRWHPNSPFRTCKSAGIFTGTLNFDGYLKLYGDGRDLMSSMRAHSNGSDLMWLSPISGAHIIKVYSDFCIFIFF